MIQIDNVSFQYSKKMKILTSLNLTFHPGKIYGLLGKNGAGKSTVIKNITGMLFPTNGTINVFGSSPRKREVDFLKDLFFVPEEYYLPNISIQKLIHIYKNFYPKFDLEQFDSYLDTFLISKDRKTNDLSLGQKKKVLIGFALSTNTKILIMDEPTNGLDIPSKITFRNMINSSFKEDRIIIISSHQVRDLDELIDQIIIMDNGQILLSKEKEQIAKQLLFEINEKEEVSDHILYQEKVSTGYGIIKPNKTGTNNYVDIELLFNAILSNNELINQL
ncbi:MAG: ABC transporter ATP-binding protein [Saprospiraceae bacterium]|nr:ABC transporter ATP-binding protein [Saprospiraceae bacterium]